MTDLDTSAIRNRLSKNLKRLRKWQKRSGESCFRLYDADLPDYNFAIDLYDDWAHIQEYAAPKSIDPAIASARRELLLSLLPEMLSIDAKHCVLKTRQIQKGTQQYDKQNKTRQRLKVKEGEALFWVNLHDYLDTGLFLDHRPLRKSFQTNMQAKRFLNCFCYTATASVHAALGGAISCNVDLSNTYLNWGKDNFLLNKLDPNQHRFIQADCMTWLAQCDEVFDVIFLDPPSFSNSKRMQDILDVQRDHITLIDNAMRCLSDEGVLYFSTNLKRFQIDPAIEARYHVQDITEKTIDEDFKRSHKIHQCFKITYRR